MTPAREAERNLLDATISEDFARIQVAQVWAILALAEAIQGLDNTFHDSLRSIAAVIGDLSDR